MQVGKVINLKSFNKVLVFLKENNILIILIAFFVFGFCFGIFSIEKFPDFESYFSDYLDSYIELRSKSDFLKIAFNSFLVSFTYLIFSFISGCSVLGAALLPFAIFISGLSNGAMMSALYAEYALKGVAINAVMILPPTVIFVAALILSAKESFAFSFALAKLTLPRTSPANLFYAFKIYCSRYLGFVLLLVFSALVDGFISRYFSAGLNI